jgi:hypothetical protein
MPRIHLRHGENELEVEGELSFIKEQIRDFYERLGLVGGKTSPTTLKQDLLKQKPKKPSEIPTPAEFYKSKGKTDGLSQLLIFGKYLEQFRETPEFTRQEINIIANEAKLSKDIHSQYYTLAVKQGLLRLHPENKYSLTLSAEEIISAM